MRVLLVQPRVSTERAYPLGLATLVPGLERAGHQVRGCDLGYHPVAHLVNEARGVDVIGFHLPSGAVPQVRDAIRVLRSHRETHAIPIVVGGPHPTLFPARALEETGADVAVAGEAEEMFPRVLEALASAKSPVLPGVTWAQNPSRTIPAPVPVALDDQPFADRVVFPISRYTQAMRSAAVPYTTVVTSRGCLGACSFCPGPRLNPRGFRPRSPEHVYGELEALVRAHGVRSVHIEDDDFFADRGRVLALCDRLRQNPLELVWEVVNGVAPERLEPEILSHIALAGCRTLVLSVEIVVQHQNGRPTVRSRPDGAPVAYRLEMVRRLVEAGARAGITMAGYFIVGMPGRTLLADLESVATSYRLGLARADYSAYQRIPGSRDWIEDLSGRRDRSGVVSALRLAAQTGFYLRPGPFWRLLEDVRRQPEVLEAIVRKVTGQVWDLVAGTIGRQVGDAFADASEELFSDQKN